MAVKIEVRKCMFGEKERPLCRMGPFTVSTFRYESGIERR
jgi:hypothetical protein